MNPFEGTDGMWLRRILIAAAAALVLFLFVQVIAGLMGLRYVGAGIAPANTISVSGHGESLAVPDIATFSFSVVSDKATVADAQADATAKINALTDYLTSAGIDKKDIQTSDYSVYPQYEYQTASCPASSSPAAVYCPPGRQVLKGYEARQTTTVKVRDTAKAGDLLAGVGAKGATEVSSLDFTFDDPAGVQQEARSKAIADAKAKAEELAKELGVSLVRVTSFTENQGGMPAPTAIYAQAGGAADKSLSPEISVGQNKTTDDVSVTYEIR